MRMQELGRGLKARLAARERLLVVNIDYSNGSLVEFLAGNGADVIFIDCEQGDTAIQSIPDLVRAAHLAGAPAIVRLFSPEPWVIERYLLRGADGIVVPRLDTAAQARQVVDTVRYCFPTTFDSLAIVVQIETGAAAQSIEAILSVDGVDALFIGPVDLAKSMGCGANYDDPAVAGEIERLIAAIGSSGRSIGMLVTLDTVAAWAARGVNFLYLHANDLLRAGSRPFLAAKSRAG